MKELIKVENLCVKLKKTKQMLVNDIGFSITAGESLTILGQSGSGKTMTCHSIMGLLDIKRFQVTGSIIFENQNLLTLSRKEKQRVYGGPIAMIPQNPMTAFDPSMRIGRQMEETLALHSNLSKSLLENKVKESLERAGIVEADRVYRSYPHTLSGGMLQRAMIAMALMVDARLIVADEPTTALDVVNRNATVESFLTLREAGTAVLLVTHDFSVATQFGGNLLIMKDSEIVEKGTTADILKRPVHSYTKALLDASRLSKANFRDKEGVLC